MEIIVEPSCMFVTEVEYSPCDFHQRFPRETFPACTCNSSYSRRRKTKEELTEKDNAEYNAWLNSRYSYLDSPIVNPPRKFVA